MNIDEILAANKQAKEREAKIVPIVKVITGSKLQVSSKPVDVEPETSKLETTLLPSHKQKILAELWENDRRVRVERNKLSSQNWRLMVAGVSAEELAAHYAKIESYRPELQANYDLIQYVEKYGHLPVQETPKPRVYSDDVNALKIEKKSLSEERSKTRARLNKALAQGKNGEWVMHWQQKLAVADAKYLEVEMKIKRINGSTNMAHGASYTKSLP